MTTSLAFSLTMLALGECAVPLVVPNQGHQVEGLAPHQEGLSLLRSDALRDRIVRPVAVVGKARQGKSFFLSAFSKAGQDAFEVRSDMDGVTKGLWIHAYDMPGYRNVSFANDTTTASCNVDRGGDLIGLNSTSICAKDDDVVTLLIDSEGNGGLGHGTDSYDKKLVFLAAMLSSAFFYNTKSYIDRHEIEFLADIVVFDTIFSNLTNISLMDGEIVWLIQSSSLWNESEQCAAIPVERLMRPTEDTAFNHIVTFLKKRTSNVPHRSPGIFCLSHPKRGHEFDELEALLSSKSDEVFDTAYQVGLNEVRRFVSQLPPKRRAISMVGNEQYNRKNVGMTGGELADWIERLVPKINDMHGAAREVIALEAEKLRKLLSQSIEMHFGATEEQDCEALEDLQTREGFDERVEAALSTVVTEFDERVLGDSDFLENRRERDRLASELMHLKNEHRLRMDSRLKQCRPDATFSCFHDYYLFRYLLPLDVIFDTILAFNFNILPSGRLSILRLPTLVFRKSLSWLREAAFLVTLIKTIPTDAVVCAPLAAVLATSVSFDNKVDSSQATLLQDTLDKRREWWGETCHGSLAILRKCLSWFIDGWLNNVSPLASLASKKLLRWITGRRYVIRMLFVALTFAALQVFTWTATAATQVVVETAKAKRESQVPVITRRQTLAVRWHIYAQRILMLLGLAIFAEQNEFLESPMITNVAIFHNTTLLRRGWESLLSLEILSPESRAQLALIVIGFGSLTIVICAVLFILWCFREFLFWLCGWKVLEHKKMEDRAGIEHNATRKAPEGVHEGRQCENHDDSTDDDIIMCGVDFSSFQKGEVIDEGKDDKNDIYGNNKRGKIEQHHVNEASVLTVADLLRKKFPLRISSLDVCGNKLQKDYERLFDWATSLGADLSKVCHGKDEYGGSGLFVRPGVESIRDGEVVLTLPRALRIGKDRVIYGSGGIPRIHGLSQETPSLSSLALLLLALLSSSERKNTSNIDKDVDGFALYATLLPSLSQVRNAVAMNQAEAQAWSRKYGQKYGAAIERERKRAECSIQYIRDVLFARDIVDESALRWAIGMVMSRSHAFGSATERYLTPILDLANHRAEGNHETSSPWKKGGARLESDPAGNLILRWHSKQAKDAHGSDIRLLPGDEVFLDYQVQNDADCVSVWGFSAVHDSSTKPAAKRSNRTTELDLKRLRFHLAESNGE